MGCKHIKLLFVTISFVVLGTINPVKLKQSHAATKPPRTIEKNTSSGLTSNPVEVQIDTPSGRSLYSPPHSARGLVQSTREVLPPAEDAGDTDDEEDKYGKAKLSTRQYWTGCFNCTSKQKQNNLDFCYKFTFKPTCQDLEQCFCQGQAPSHPICTHQRVLGLAGFAALYGGSAYLFYECGTGVFRELALPIEAFIFINGTETMLSIGALFASIPPNAEKTPPEQLKQLAVIIPVHGAEKDIQPTLESLIAANIQPSQIFVIENTGNRYAREASKTFQLLEEDPRYGEVNYRYISAWGSKVAAEYLGTVVAANEGFKYMMAIDDDVIMPEGFDPYLTLIHDDIKMVAYPIKPSNNTNYLTQNQQNEYRRADRHNYFKSNLGTLLAPHGAISVSEIETYLENMRKTPVDGAFFAEDQKKGIAWRWAGHRIAMAPGPAVETEAPDNCSTFWSQRVGSWDTGAHLINPVFVEDLITDCQCNPTCNIQDIGNLAIRKIYQIQSVYSNFSDLVRPVILISFANYPYFWAVVGGIWEANNLINIADDVYFAPHRNGTQPCMPREVARSCLDHHSSIGYTLAQLCNGSTAACCAYVGAGAASAKDFMIKLGFPADLRKLLDVPENDDRNTKLLKFMDQIGPDPRQNRVRPLSSHFMTR